MNERQRNRPSTGSLSRRTHPYDPEAPMNAPSTDPQKTGRLPAQRRPHQHDVLDVTLHDEELRAETDLTAQLMIAVNDADHDGPLPQDEIDRLLGLG